MLSDHWLDNASPPTPHNGAGGIAQKDEAVSSRSILLSDANCGDIEAKVYVAAKTWAISDTPEGGGWCLTILRYDYETGTATDSPFRYPAEPSNNNYFVPTAMTVFQDYCSGSDAASPANTWIVVTGYGKSVAYGQTDYHTVCFNGDLTPRWSHTHSRPGAISTSFIDEYPVGIDHATGVNYTADPPVDTHVVGVTGNTWNGTDWDIQTIYYDMLNSGALLGAVTHDSSSDDKACGIRMFGDSTGDYPNARSYIVGTQGTGSGNAVVAQRVIAHATAPGSWTSTTRTRSVSGATLKANAMHADFLSGTGRDAAFAAGQYTDSSASHMLLAKFDFSGTAEYYTTFSYNGGSTRVGEALSMDYVSMSGIGTLIALGGYSYRDSSHGNDSVIALFHEDSGEPELRWSAWTKQTGTAYNASDACTDLAIWGDHDGISSLDDFYVHCAAQFPTSTSDMDLRAIVFSSDDGGVTPSDPSTKTSSGDPVNVSGSASGGDIPRHLEMITELMQGLDPGKHNFIVVGDVWNGSTNGFDVLTRRFRFTEPE